MPDKNQKFKCNSVSCAAAFLEYGLINDNIGNQIRNHLLPRGKQKYVNEYKITFLVTIVTREKATKSKLNVCVNLTA
jgi:hypothetical protein